MEKNIFNLKCFTTPFTSYKIINSTHVFVLVKKEREEKSAFVKKELEVKEHHHPSSEQRGHERTSKRERDESDDRVSVKKHCADDEEINAQVQNAIDSILNLGNNRSDPALDEAVRSILTS